MKALRVVCKFLLSLVQVLFPRGLKGRHSRPGDPMAGGDSTAVDPVVAAGGGPGSRRSDPVYHSSGSGEPEQRPPSLTTGNLMGWLLITVAAVKLFC